MPADREVVERLRGLLARATPLPWLIHSEPDVNYPSTIHAKSTHRIGGVGDPIEPLSNVDQALVVEGVNALPELLDTIASLKARVEELEKGLERIVAMDVPIDIVDTMSRLEREMIEEARTLLSESPSNV